MQGQKKRLRICLLLDGAKVAAWAYRMIDILRHSDYAEISLVVMNAAETRAQPAAKTVGNAGQPVPTGILDAAGRRLLAAAERRLVGKPGQLPDAFECKDVTAVLAGVDVLEVTPGRGDGFDAIEGPDLARIKARDLDVCIQLGFRRLRGGVLQSMRYGVWSCRECDFSAGASDRPGYREVMQSHPVTASSLRILAEDSNDHKVVCESFSSTRDMSLADNASSVQWKTLHFIPRKLKELHEDGAERFFARIAEPHARPRSHGARNHEVHEIFGNVERGALLWKKLLQKLRRKWDARRHLRQWFLLYDIAEGMSTSLRHFKHLAPPTDRFWADPFVVARDGKYYVFFEELLYATQKGHISVLVMNRDGAWEAPVRVLEAPYHLSYPFIFEFEGAVYMTPESRQNRSVELYKCTAFPHSWGFQATLMQDCDAVDPTLLQWQGRWWLFVNQVETDGASLWDELFVYCSDSPLSGHWTPHRRNPVVSDVRSARPAGRLFVRDGRLYRPSQDCSVHYGYGFNICEITKLSETDYEERIVSRVVPDWDPNVVSTHTFNSEGGLTIVDGQRRRRRR